MTKDSSCKKYNAIDILKFILSVLVMIIHSGIDKKMISPVLRTAVPLFFIISGYLFFFKNQKLLSEKEKNMALMKLIKRNLLLYLFWTVVQFPLRFFMRGYHKDGLLSGLLKVLKDLAIGGGFTGAWYILSLVVAIMFLYFASKKISSMFMFLLTFPMYILSCLLTNYYNLLDTNSFVLSIGSGYYAVLGMQFYTSFPVALFWISMGRVLAEKQLKIRKSILWIAGILFSGFLVLERYLIVMYDWGITDDCYFMLVLICPVIFMLVSKSNIAVVTRIPVREMSILLYVTHGCCGRLISFILGFLHVNEFLQITMKMLFSLIVSYVLYHFIRYLKDKAHIKMLEYAY